MARIVRIFKTLRNNWKKSTVGFLLVSYGVNYGVTKFRTKEMLRLYCEEAKSYGDVPLPIGLPARQITVVLNPASNGGKGKSEFEDYCAPLLYLSGMKISVVKTESVGEARGLMEVMDNCDAVVVAGGDGAITEAVTGLLRRNDSGLAVQRFPIGIIPVGKLNNISKSIFKEHKDDRIKLMAEATMAIIRDFQKQVDVMKVEILENSDNPTGKPIYALGELKWGAFRDVEERIGKYWLWGPLKSYAAYFFGAFKSLTWNCNAQFHYTVPCEGCNNCMRNKMQDANELKFGSQVQNTRWWHAFIPRTKSVKDTKQVKDYSKVVNPECGVWHQKDFSSVEFQVLTENNVNFSPPNLPKHLEVNLGPENISGFEFVKEGWLRTKTETSHMNREKILVRQFEMIPKIEESSIAEKEATEEGKSVEVEERWYSIDNDNYEVKPIRVTVLPDAIKVFSASTSR
ncbi:acylglycerol kinase, mitochondrial-like [Daphnia pulicaria]|uniref:acylglycerol kinase, mitochondrial-like n=1 Tax=Daphnia pulicaria TaxID=35523 RepID=UPI001EEA3573|nr:acylglycerol kinase, mitochondrial-like [Daphnia pulicaria]